MKKVIIGMFFVIGLIASAHTVADAPLELNDSLLAFEITPTKYGPKGMGNTMIAVRNDGLVTSRHCPVGPGDCTTRFIQFYDESEINHLASLIEDARDVQVVGPDEYQCLALPVENRIYLADGGKLTLREGAFPCGSVVYNPSKASESLIKELDSLRTASRSAIDMEYANF